MIRTVFRICIVLACGDAAAHAERAVLECIADTWIGPGDRSVHGRDRTLSAGGGRATLAAFRTSAVEGWKISRATLLLHPAGRGLPHRLRIAPLREPWSEDAAVWRSLRIPRGRWRRAAPYQEGWVAIEVPPDAVTSHGLAIKGEGANLQFDSRETVAHSPYLLIEGSR